MEYQRLSKNMRPEDRFWARVQKTDTCWLWLGATSGGYGRIMVNNVSMGAHKFAYELHTGTKVAQHMVVDHLCMVKACVRPDHLEPVTQAENIRRAVPHRSKTRKPTKNPKVKAPVVPNALSQYCSACMVPAPECGVLKDHVCESCWGDHKAKALAAIEALMKRLGSQRARCTPR